MIPPSYAHTHIALGREDNGLSPGLQRLTLDSWEVVKELAERVHGILGENKSRQDSKWLRICGKLGR